MRTKPFKQSQFRFISLRVKLLIGFTVLFSGVFTVAYYWFYTFASAKALERIEQDMVNTLNGALSRVDGDEFARLAAVRLRSGQQVPNSNWLYQHHQKWLNIIHTIEPRAFPYTFIKGGDRYDVLWIGDSLRFLRPDEASTFRQPYIADPANTVLYQGFSRLTVQLIPYTDAWGNWISAYGPIKNSAGQVVGGMGIDFDANYFYDVRKAIGDRILVAFIITYAILLSLVYMLSGILTQHLIELTHSANRISVGTYHSGSSLTKLAKNKSFPDELDILSHVFEDMVENIRAREGLLKAIVEDQAEFICRFLADGSLTLVNDAYCRYLGKSREEVIGQNFLTLFSPSSTTALKEQIAALEVVRPVNTLEHCVMPCEIEPCWQQWTIRALFNDLNQINEFQAVGRDISKRKQAEEALRESEARYRALVEQIPAVTFIAAVDNPGKVIYVSPQIEMLLGYSQAEWLATPNLWCQQLHPDDCDRVLAGLAITNHSKSDSRIQEYRLMTRTGQIRWVRDDAILLTDDMGQSLFWQGILVDISDRKRIEEDLQQLNVELEVRVQERTIALRLANKQLDHRAQQQQVIAELGQQALSGMDLPQLMHAAAMLVAQALQVDFEEILDLLLSHNSLTSNFSTLISKHETWMDFATTHAKRNTVAACTQQSYGTGVSANSCIPLAINATQYRQLSKDDMHFLRAVTNVLATAIERKQVEERLQASLTEKELLLQEVHHRVKNNLQIISSMFSLQSQCVDDPQILSTLADSQNRIRSMALIHEKLYQVPSLSKIDFADYIRSLATSLFASYNTSSNLVHLNLHITDVALNLDAAIPCGLLINELVSNSLKHAFPNQQSGEINIDFAVNDRGQLELTVQDNGKGLPPDLEVNKTNSLGLRLVRALTRQLSGTLEVDGSHGTRFKITFPKPQERKRF